MRKTVLTILGALLLPDRGFKWPQRPSIVCASVPCVDSREPAVPQRL